MEMSRYVVAGMAMALLGAGYMQANAQEKTHSSKKPTIEQRLRAIEDEEEIRELLIPYGRDFDERDFTAYAQLFAGDGLDVHGEPAPSATGHYEDMLVREEGVWKFKRRQVFAEAKQP